MCAGEPQPEPGERGMARGAAEQGFAKPAEWAPHQRCWMAWPCREASWQHGLAEARRCLAELARSIRQFEPVTVVVRPDLATEASLELGAGIPLLPLPHDDSWMRDTGPTFVVHPERGLGGVVWRFNGWGGVVPDHAQDAEMARRILEREGARAFFSELVFEGGNLCVDGEGTALVCAPGVLDPARNPGIGREDVARELAVQLGIDRVIWLPRALVDDETGGHVDNLARFVRPGVVAVVRERGDGPHAEALEANWEALAHAVDARGRKLELLELPMPKPRRAPDGSLLTTSYANFYIANGAVFLPAFDDPADHAARRMIESAFPDREVVQIGALELLHGGGGIHCVTLEQPRPPEREGT